MLPLPYIVRYCNILSYVAMCSQIFSYRQISNLMDNSSSIFTTCNQILSYIAHSSSSIFPKCHEIVLSITRERKAGWRRVKFLQNYIVEAFLLFTNKSQVETLVLVQMAKTKCYKIVLSIAPERKVSWRSVKSLQNHTVEGFLLMTKNHRLRHWFWRKWPKPLGSVWRL